MLDSILDFFNSLFDIWHWSNVLILPGLLIGFTVHELGHAVTAYFLGDMSQVQEGKITINLSLKNQVCSCHNVLLLHVWHFQLE